MIKIFQVFCLAASVPLVFGAYLAIADVPDASGWKRIEPARILEIIKVLSSDEYAGRAPASPGETLATTYIEDQFKKVGLKPGNLDGTYFQPVPLVGIKADPSAQLTFTNAANGQQETLKFADDFVAGPNACSRKLESMPIWFLSATASKRPNINGMTLKAWT